MTKKILITSILIFVVALNANIALASPVKYTDSYIQNLATQTFNKLITQILPKDKLTTLFDFSSHLSYDDTKGGTQTVYLPEMITSDGTSYLSTQNISSGSLTVSGNGITIYDRTTGEPECIYSDNGTLQISSGSC